MQHRHAILCRAISIHAPHEGERLPDTYGACKKALISIHAPHEGERRDACHPLAGVDQFQSTLPTRGSDFVISPPVHHACISIHAPHEGERRLVALINHEIDGFQSTLPTRGSDLCPSGLPAFGLHFNPRSPRGGATGSSTPCAYPRGIFQSTLPTRGSDPP